MRRVLVLPLIALLTAAGAPAEDLDRIRSYREEHAARILEEFVELLAIPNVARDLPNIRRNAEWIRDGLRERGVAAELWKIEGVPPIVYGRLDVEGATRTLGLYVHYDGQPVDPARWTWDPWQPTLASASLEVGGVQIAMPGPGDTIDPEWRLYARGAGDDKAPIAAIFGALDALRAAGRTPTSNLLFFFEGEEEAGSDHLRAYMEAHRQQLEVDAWLICDGPVHQSRRPQLVFGVRGYTGFDLTVFGATRYLHSGHYGNWAPNPALLLARLLATMKDEEGRVLVEGFYDSTAPVGDAERRALAAAPAYDEELRRELGLAATEMDNEPLLERLLWPSFNIRGMESAAVGESARNVIPTEATASVDIRLAKGNDPEQMLDLVERHLRAQGVHLVAGEPSAAERARHPRIARFIRRSGYPAARTSMDLPLVAELVAAAELASGEEVVLLPTFGGSLPLYLFTDVLAAPVVIVPIANHDDNQHAPDENLRLANLFYGIDLMAAIFAME